VARGGGAACGGWGVATGGEHGSWWPTVLSLPTRRPGARAPRHVGVYRASSTSARFGV